MTASTITYPFDDPATPIAPEPPTPAERLTDAIDLTHMVLADAESAVQDVTVTRPIREYAAALYESFSAIVGAGTKAHRLTMVEIDEALAYLRQHALWELQALDRSDD